MWIECWVLTGLMFRVVASAPAAVPAAPPPAMVGVGVGLPRGTGPQARLMAGRTAEVRAVRDLARKLGIPNGQPIPPFHYASRSVDGGGHVTVVVTRFRPFTEP